jgi:hypothetical protein
LRVLELPLAGTLSPHLLHALATAPVFQSLELALPKRVSQCSPQEALLGAALSSWTWCSVRLFFPEETTNDPVLPSAVDVAKVLPLVASEAAPSVAALNRLRVFVCCASQSIQRCFVLRKPSAEGPLKWLRDY